MNSSLFKKEEIRSLGIRSWSISWPMILIMFFDFLIGLTDIYIAGRVGKEIQASYGFVIQLYFIFIVIANFITVGTVSVVSHLFPSGDDPSLTEAIFSSLILSIIGGLVLSGISFFLAPPIILKLNLPDPLKGYALPLIQIYSVRLTFHYLLINSNGILRSCGRVKKSLMSMALVCGINIGLNFFFVFHTPIRFKGIALATSLSVFFGSVLNLAMVKTLTKGRKRFSVDQAKRILNIGWPLGLLQIFWQLSTMVIFLILSTLPEHRIEILAALTTGLRVESAIYLPVIGSNMANAVIVGNLLGERKKEEAFQNGIMTAVIGVFIVLLMVIGVILNARWVVSLLSSNEIVMKESIRYLYISMISEPFMAWGIILSGGLNGAGDTKNVLFRIAFSLWCIRIPLSYIFVVWLGFGAHSVWWSMNLSQFVQAFLISKRYFSKEWL